MKRKDMVPCKEPNHTRETPVTLHTILAYSYKKVASDFWSTLIINENGGIPDEPLDDAFIKMLKLKGIERYKEMAQDNDGSVSPDDIKNKGA